MQRTHTTTHSRRKTRSDVVRERIRLSGFVFLMLVCGAGLGALGGAPRLPDAAPRLEQFTALLSGSTLPVKPLAVVLVDLAWLMWLWIVSSLGLELFVVAAEGVAHGAAWARSLRGLADRVTFPLARRAVTAAFAVQILSRGVPMAAAQELTPAEASIVAEASYIPRPTTIGAGLATAQSTRATYVVRAGDTLWSIAEQAYGSGTAYRRVLDANVGRRMPDGQVFTARGVIQPGWELVVPNPTPRIDEVDDQRWYTVGAGDTLSDIADTTLGDQSQWPALFELNRGAESPDGTHALSNPNVIWPGLRLRLPPVATAKEAPVEVHEATKGVESVGSGLVLVAASSVPPSAPPASVEAAIMRSAESGRVQPPEDVEPLPLVRTLHVLEPVALEASQVGEPAGGSEPVDVVSPPSTGEGAVPAISPPVDLAAAPVVMGGLGLVVLAGVALGARRARRLRPIPHEPESDVVVDGGFAEAPIAHDFTRSLHGTGFDPVAAMVDQLQRFLDEYDLGHVDIVGLRHGRSATTLTLAAGLAEQTLLVDLAHVFAARLEADAEAWVSGDQDVVLRLVRVRKTRLFPAADGAPERQCLVPLGVLYDRQVYVATCKGLGHVLIASLPGHGAETILTSLVATLTARRSPDHLRVWMIARPRSVAAPLFDLPHLARSIDPGDEAALAHVVDDLRAELDRRALQGPGPDLVVVVSELTSLGQHAASFELLASRAASLGVRFIAATGCPDEAALSPLLGHFGSRMVLRMQHEEASVALLGLADAAFLGGGGRLLLRLDGREPVELYGYQVVPEHLERLVRVMRSAYSPRSGAPTRAGPEEQPEPPSSAPAEPGSVDEPQAEPGHVSETDTPSATHAAPEVRAAEQSQVAEVAITEPVPPIQVICFGGPRVLCAGQQVWPRRPGGEAKPWELLLYLACQPAEGVSSEDAVQALWPEDDDAPDPGHRFRQLRYRLRHLLPATPVAKAISDGICFERGTLSLDPRVVSSDAQEFLGLARSARINPGPGAIAHLERARELYVGDLLEGPDARRYAWVDERDDSGVTLREHFRRLFQHASTRLAELYQVTGALTAAVDLYRELTEIDASDERLWCALFRLHADRGDRLALMREEHRMRSALRNLAADADPDADAAAADGLRIEDPSRETVQEYQRLLAGLYDADRQAAAV